MPDNLVSDLFWEEKKIKLKDLKEYSRNPRRISKDDFEKLKKSMEESGYNQRLLVDVDNTIIAGHQRYQVFKKLKFEEIPILKPNRKLTEDEFKRINIQDNVGFGEWDIDQLANDFDIPQLLEWGMPEDLFKGLDPEPEEEIEEVDGQDEIPETPVNPVTKNGNLWILGKHKLICGDSTKQESLNKLISEKKAKMIFTDPPYNTGMNSKTNSGSTRLNHFFDDNYTQPEWLQFLKDMCISIYSVLEKDSVAYICFTWKRNHELFNELVKSFEVSNVIVWDKVVHGLGSDYKYTYELINVCKKGRPKLNTHYSEEKEYSDVWHIQRQVGRNEEHATQKPVKLIERAVKHATFPEDTVMDLFAGSGSTLIACEKMNRNCSAIELEPKYVDTIIKRWQDLTGEEAYLQESGKTYNELAKEADA